jgi:hypothetical protein
LEFLQIRAAEQYLEKRIKKSHAKTTIPGRNIKSPDVSTLKGVWHEIFSFLFLSQISFPHGPKYPVEAISNFYENSRIYSNVRLITGINDNGDKWVKFLRQNRFPKFCLEAIGFHYTSIECLFFKTIISRFGQINIRPTVLSPVSCNRWKSGDKV